MAIRCDVCNYLFSTPSARCPFCGRRLISDSTDNDLFLMQGFIWAPGQAPALSSDHDTESDSGFSATIDHLRSAFFEEHESELSPSSDYIPVFHQPDPLDLHTDSGQSPAGAGYFDYHDRESASEVPIPTVEPEYLGTSGSRQPVIDDSDQPYNDFDWQNLFSSILDHLSNISWRVYGRILLLVLLIIIVVTLWKNRYLILSSFTSLLAALLPLILSIWILWRIIKSFLS